MEILRGTTRWKFFLQTSQTFLNQNFEIKLWENQNLEVNIFESTPLTSLDPFFNCYLIGKFLLTLLKGQDKPPRQTTQDDDVELADVLWTKDLPGPGQGKRGSSGFLWLPSGIFLRD